MAKTPGPKPQSTAAKKLAGNPGKRPLNDREPEVPPGAPIRPDWLTAERTGEKWSFADACEEWDRVVPILLAAGTLTELDLAALTNYCVWWAVEQEAMRKVAEFGLLFMSKQNQPYNSPYLNVLAQASKQVQTWQAELGLSSSSRSRIKVPDKPAPGDPLAELLMRRGSRPN